jgi:hypothetical protein
MEGWRIDSSPERQRVPLIDDIYDSDKRSREGHPRSTKSDKRRRA